MPIQTLLILGSSLTALAVVRSTSRAQLRCLLVDDRRGPASRTRLATFCYVSAANVAAVRGALPVHCQPGEVAIIADSDRWLRFVQANYDALAAEGFLILHPLPSVIGTCLDKSAFLRWCAARKLPAPRLFEVSMQSLPAAGDYPLLLRPELTQHSAQFGLPKAIEVRNAAQLVEWLDRFKAAGVTPTVCQSLLTDGLRQFSVGFARNPAGEVRTFLAEKIRPQAERCAGGTYVKPAVQSGVEALATAAVTELEFFGVGEVEVLFDTLAGRGYLIEVNARPWLQFGLSAACGVDLLGHVLGRPVADVGPSGRLHAWLYFSSDLYACFSRGNGLVRTGRVSLAEYIGSLARADVYATWDRRDPWPLVSSCWESARGLLKRS